jgi:Xaa-Pro aminopeptidase
VSPRTIASRVQAAGLDAVIAFSAENVYYLSGVAILTQRLIPSRLAMVAWTANDDKVMIVCTIEEAQVRAESRISDIAGYTEFAESPVAALAAELDRLGLRNGRIGVEADAIAQSHYGELSALLPGATFVAADRVFQDARMVKTADEIGILAHAAAVTELAIHTTFAEVAAGDTEASVADAMESRVRGSDAGVAFTVLATGANAHLVHPSPSNLPLRAGSIVRTELGGYFGARYAGYMSDLARTAVVSRANSRQTTTYQYLSEVHRELIDSLRPGVRACDVFERCRKAFERRAMTFTRAHVGHGIGISVREPPMLSPHSAQVLLPGMVLAIGPITASDDGIYHIEDMVEITDAGARVLSSGHDWTRLPVIG